MRINKMWTPLPDSWHDMRCSLQFEHGVYQLGCLDLDIFAHLTSRTYRCCEWLPNSHSNAFARYIHIVTLTSDLLSVRILYMWYSMGATLLPSLKAAWPSVHQLWRILCLDVVRPGDFNFSLFYRKRYREYTFAMDIRCAKLNFPYHFSLSHILMAHADS